MRVSVDKDDPGYSPLATSAVLQVLLNGLYVAHCVTADEERGYVVSYVEDENGNIIIDGDQGLRITRSGNVQIVLKPGFSTLDFSRLQ